eukprot:11932054-Ditylum_brightwellii.AAC.1
MSLGGGRGALLCSVLGKRAKAVLESAVLKMFSNTQNCWVLGCCFNSVPGQSCAHQHSAWAVSFASH